MTQPTERTNDERSPIDDTLVKKNPIENKSVIQVKQVAYQATQKQEQILTTHWIINQYKSWKWMKTWRPQWKMYYQKK